MNEEMKEKKKFQLHALNPMVLLVIIITIAAIATYIVPAGVYDRVLDPATEQEIVNPATFHYIAQQPIGAFDFFKSVTLGLQRAAGAGYAGAMTNAFTVGVAQGISGLPLFSGIGLRAALFITLMIVSITYVMIYARKIKKNPLTSSVHEEDLIYNQHLDLDDIPVMTTRHKLVLLVFLGTIIALVFGVIKFAFYIDELAALFLICGILCGLVGGLKAGEIADSFVKGCGDLLYACLMVGCGVCISYNCCKDWVWPILIYIYPEGPRTFLEAGPFGA